MCYTIAMPDYIDTKYIHLISSNLLRFKEKKPGILYNFRCPFCGDSEKNTIKARGYLFSNGEVFLYKCWNCGLATNLYELLKHVDASLFRSYALDKFSHKIIKKPNDVPKISAATSCFVSNKPIDRIVNPIVTLPQGHWVIDYIMHRQIPRKFWNDLYFTPDYKSFVYEFNKERSEALPEDDVRLVIPFYDENHELCGFQGRTLTGSKVKYITILLEDSVLKVYGLERVQKDQQIQVVEGPIDSMFLPNAVATCDFDLSRAAKYLSKENLVLIWDNQYQNNDIKKSIVKAIDNGFAVCIFPKTTKHKDINEMVISGVTIEEIATLIQDNTFTGLRAKLELQNNG